MAQTSPTAASLQELNRAAREAAADFGRAMAGWELGTVSNQERGQAMRRMKKAEEALRFARYSEASA